MFANVTFLAKTLKVTVDTRLLLFWKWVPGVESFGEMGDHSPSIVHSSFVGVDSQSECSVQIEVHPTRNSSCVTIEEIAPQNNTISSEKQTCLSNGICCFIKSVADKRLSSTEKNVKRYYNQMEEIKATFKEVNTQDIGSAPNLSAHNDNAYMVSIVIRMSLFCNLVLLIAKAVASYLSGSMSIISSLVDSAVDFIFGIVVWWTLRAIKGTDYHKYPVGKTRLEPISIIVLAVIMAVASIQVVISSATDLIEQSADPDISVATMAIIGATIAIKIALYLYFRSIPNQSTTVLAQDHLNDILSNAVALGFGYMGSKLWNGIDPIGAILISIYIFWGWYRVGSEQIRSLTGYKACPMMLQKLLWVCMNHDNRVQFIDTLRAYHFGLNLLVEVHIVLPPDMHLREAHDIGESLQMKLESYPEVERAFVHIDYDYEHLPSVEHRIDHL